MATFFIEDVQWIHALKQGEFFSDSCEVKNEAEYIKSVKKDRTPTK